ncbi:MAG: C1 family peptidase [Bacteroides sp.]|nr:C1 family peptidase [Bacteroides sp.]MCM1412912.1 C1 family peptidase [Bacteroides sp.]MCM1471581.1 C1 family peptidase [Bacteroides sp.]
MKRMILLGLVTCSLAVAGFATDRGGISGDMLQRLRSSYQNTAVDRALRNAMAQTDISTLASNADNQSPADMHFTYRVPSKGITNQRSSGRCWLFTGLNVLRAQMMNRHDLPKLELSQNYNFFYDQLEKSNLFLQSVIDTYKLDFDDKKVEWLFKNPLSDGGQYTGLSDNIMKYGVVPAEVWPETYSANNTSQMRRLISLKLREDGLELRAMLRDGAKAKAAEERKEAMLAEIYRMLALTLGVPPTEFQWTRYDKAGNVVDRRTYTPLEFYNEYAGNDLKHDYVMLMNDPTRPYYQLYEIDLDRHLYDGENWTYINLPVEDIKMAAIRSLADSTMMYFSCDVGQMFDRKRGVLDVDNFNYGELFGTQFGMNKADRIRTFASASSHAMTLVAVDLDADGKPTRWMVENSWGPGVNDGHLVMTDRWFDEYMFRLVVDRKYLDDKVLDVLKQKPQLLPAWDPMFSADE